MPSSLIFTGLVVLWLLILVPAVARHQQEVARPSGASLAGRVLVRPRRSERRFDGHPSEERDSVDDDDGARTAGARPKDVTVSAAREAAQRTDVAVKIPVQSRWDDEPDARRAVELDELELDAELDGELDDGDHDHDRNWDHDREWDRDHAGEHDEPDSEDGRWERPPPRYRPGRGGFDPEADAEGARRRYAFRQRMVLFLLVSALLTAVAAVTTLRVLWWAHAGIDVVLVSYLVYLRRQVREEAEIRTRRASRMAGTRQTSAADDHELDEWARRGREATRRPVPDAEASAPSEHLAEKPAREHAEGRDELDDLDGVGDDDSDDDRVRGAGEPVGLLPARRRGTDDDTDDAESALPPLRPAPSPPLPPGTSLVEVDDDELDLHDLGAAGRPHRRAVGE